MKCVFKKQHEELYPE